MATKEVNITATDFGKYLAVQRSGATNMWDFRVVKALTGLSENKILYIIEHYEELEEQFNK